MQTNRWKLHEIEDETGNEIYIIREQDNIPILKMITSVEVGDELLNVEEAKDVAEQIIECWNFDCEELET
jgi:hypothetical protein